MKMKKLIATGLVVAALTVTVPASADTITIDDPSDGVAPNPTITAGDYTVAGNGTASSPGQVEEVLFGSPDTAATVTGSNSMSLADIWNFLNDGGVTSTTSLYLAFGNNQQGSTTALQTTTITQLDIAITGDNADTWSLGTDIVAVVNVSGANTAEAIFEIALGYDFITTYSASTTDWFFTIESTYTGNNDGFETYFFDPQFFPAGPSECPPGSDNEVPPCDDVVSVPEPGTLGLLGLGLLGLAIRRRNKA